MQIELRTYQYAKYGVMMEQHYLVLRCNPTILVGEKTKVFLVDLEKYPSDEILQKLQKRLYEVNEFRYVRLDRLPVSIFLADRVDIAKDVLLDFPQLVVWLANMSFPYGYRNMKRKMIHKKIDELYIESCTFYNHSRSINIYHKWIEMINNHKTILPEEEQRIQSTVRFEIQIEKKGIYNLKLPTKRSIAAFLEQDFRDTYLEKEIKAIFGTERYVSRSRAAEIISNSHFKPYDKQVMSSIIDTIYRFRGLYGLERAIADEDIHSPPQYGNLRSFKQRWLGRFKQLGIQPVVLPDSLGMDEMPSIYELLTDGQMPTADRRA